MTPAEVERAVERTGARYLTDMETILNRVGRVYEGQLAAKDQTIDTQAGALALQQETIAELRRRAEVAEAEADALRLRLAEIDVPAVVVVAGQDATEEQDATPTTPVAHRGVQRLWRRLRRRLAGG